MEEEYQQCFYISFRAKCGNYYTAPAFERVMDFCLDWPDRIFKDLIWPHAEILNGDYLRCYRTRRIRILMVLPDKDHETTVNKFVDTFKRKFPEWSIKVRD